jgi:hypothetical protein
MPVIPHSGVYATGKLSGSTVSDLYASYLGHTGMIPKKLSIDWNRQLTRLWARKNAISGTTAVRETGAMLVAE